MLLFIIRCESHLKRMFNLRSVSCFVYCVASRDWFFEMYNNLFYLLHMYILLLFRYVFLFERTLLFNELMTE